MHCEVVRAAGWILPGIKWRKLQRFFDRKFDAPFDKGSWQFQVERLEAFLSVVDKMELRWGGGPRGTEKAHLIAVGVQLGGPKSG